MLMKNKPSIGYFSVMNMVRKSMSLKEFKDMAESENYKPPKDSSDYEELERKFWFVYNEAVYSCGHEGGGSDRGMEH